MQTPDVTKVQVIALIQAVAAVVAALGFNIPTAVSAALIGSSAAIAGLLTLADALIRGNRAKIVVAESQAKAGIQSILHQLEAQTGYAPPAPEPQPQKAVSATSDLAGTYPNPTVAAANPATANPPQGSTS